MKGVDTYGVVAGVILIVLGFVMIVVSVIFIWPLLIYSIVALIIGIVILVTLKQQEYIEPIKTEGLKTSRNKK